VLYTDLAGSALVGVWLGCTAGSVGGPFEFSRVRSYLELCWFASICGASCFPQFMFLRWFLFKGLAESLKLS
jgi:hypothetical protein